MLTTSFLLFIQNVGKRDYYDNQCNHLKKEEKRSTSETIYPHNLSSIFNWTSAIENISDKKLVALSSSEFRARAGFKGVAE